MISFSDFGTGIQMERANIIKISLALIAMASIMLAFSAPALADQYAGDSDKPSMDKGKYDRMGKEPKDVYMTIAVDGMTDNTATFSVMNMAMKGKEDKAVLIMPSAPLTGTYNMTNDMGYISTASFMPATITIDTMNKTSVPVAGASAVMGMHDIKVMAKDKDYKVFKFGEVSFLTPNGTAKNYKLDKPVRVIYSRGQENGRDGCLPVVHAADVRSLRGRRQIPGRCDADADHQSD